jgi:hypothetical protein
MMQEPADEHKGDPPRPWVAIHQPNYAPWLGYFVKATTADLFVLLDDVQFSKGSYANRTRVCGPNGPEFLTVPVRHGGFRSIREVSIAEPQWADRHRRQLRAYYRGSPGLDLAEDALLARGLDGLESLAEANEVVLRRILNILDVERPLVRSCSLGVAVPDATTRLVEICRKIGGRTYISGRGAAAYNEPKRFREAGIALAYIEFEHPSYPQPYGCDFTPGLSILDFVCANGDQAKARFASVLQSVQLSSAPRN